MVRDEAMIVQERVNGMLATEMVILRQAVHSLMSKDAGKAFQKSLKRIRVEARPRAEDT